MSTEQPRDEVEGLIEILRRLEELEQSLKENGSEHHRKQTTEIRSDIGDWIMRQQIDDVEN